MPAWWVSCSFLACPGTANLKCVTDNFRQPCMYVCAHSRLTETTCETSSGRMLVLPPKCGPREMGGVRRVGQEGDCRCLKWMKIEEVERLEKRKTGTHGSQRLDQLFSLPGGSRLSQIRAGIKCTQLSPIYLSWYTGK